MHYGATSQDINDTASMLIAGRALGPIAGRPVRRADACARLAEAHRGTVIVGRTVLQHAVADTLRAQGGGLARIETRWTARGPVGGARLPVQYGGAAGTLSVRATGATRSPPRLAAELGLAEPVTPWHTTGPGAAELAAPSAWPPGRSARSRPT